MIKLTTKLLAYLNPDPAHIRDITKYMFGTNTERDTDLTIEIIKNASKDGWKIHAFKDWYSLPDKRKGKRMKNHKKTEVIDKAAIIAKARIDERDRIKGINDACAGEHNAIQVEAIEDGWSIRQTIVAIREANKNQ